MPKLSVNFGEILLCAGWNFEERNVLESSVIIIINYCIIIEMY